MRARPSLERFRPTKSWRFGIFVTHDRSIDKRPVNADIGIIPQNGALASLVVESAGFVEEFGVVGQRKESVGEAFWDPELMAIFGCQHFAYPSPKAWGTLANVDSNIEGRTADDANELALSVRRQLIMQAA